VTRLAADHLVASLRARRSGDPGSILPPSSAGPGMGPGSTEHQRRLLAERLEAARRSAPRRVRAWDLPTRLFHWLLVMLIASAYFTRTYSDDPTLYWHRITGYAMLALLLFRLIWGFAGSSTSRFAAFVPWPKRALRYVLALLRHRPMHYLGHNPLGAALIFAMLLAVAAQAVAGLFTTDDVLAQGPLHDRVPAWLADRMGIYHAKGLWIALALAAVHVVANLVYHFVMKDRLITAMVTGDKPALDYEDQLQARPAPQWRAVVCAALAVAIVVGGVILAGDSVLR